MPAHNRLAPATVDAGRLPGVVALVRFAHRCPVDAESEGVRMRRAAKIDRNQPEIVAALRRVGATVVSLAAAGDGIPDLLVGFRSETFLLEVKDEKKPPSARQLTPDQVGWHIRWCGGPCKVVNSVDEALAFIGVTQ